MKNGFEIREFGPFRVLRYVLRLKNGNSENPNSRLISVPRDRIELPTQGFSVPRSGFANYLKMRQTVETQRLSPNAYSAYIAYSAPYAF